jgi:hypothetical protein
MRNAVKKRMQKLRLQQQQEEKKNRKQDEQQLEAREENQVLGMVGTEFKTKYPKGSCIMFTASHKKGEKPASVSCCWYNKTGIKGKNLVSNPPEWQNISMEEMDKIFEMFDEHLYMPIVYV